MAWESATVTRGRAPDPRPGRTKEAILAAITELSARGDAVTVAAIAAEAGISRSSFYAHYRDVGDVALTLMRELYDRIETVDVEMRSEGSAIEATLTTTGLLIYEIAAHRELYAAVLGSTVTGETYREVQAILAEGALATMQRVAPASIDADLAATYTAAGMLAVIVTWLTRDDPIDAEVLQAQLLSMLPPWVTGVAGPTLTR